MNQTAAPSVAAPGVAPGAVQQRVVVVVNPTAGKGRGAAALLPIKEALARRAVESEVFFTRAEGEAHRLVSRLTPPAGTVVLAVGGDGTAHEVGTALVGRDDLTLGVIPTGSGNDYARLLGMPLHPRAAVDALLEGVDARWDVGAVGPHLFLNSAGFAFSAQVSAESRRTGPLTGMARYLWAVGRALARFQSLAVTLDGLRDPGPGRITLMEVGIGDRCGGGFRLLPKADPRDGLLDVCHVKPMSRLSILMLLPRAAEGHHLRHRLVSYEQVPAFRLRLEAPTLIHVDGELRALDRGEHVVAVRPRGLRVRVAAGRGAQRRKGAA